MFNKKSNWKCFVHGPKILAVSYENGKISSKERFLDSLCSFASQLIVSQFIDLGDALVYSNQYVRGSYERLYDMEQKSDLRKVFHDFVERFKCDG